MVESKPLNCLCRLRQLSGSGGCTVGVKEVSRMKRALRAAFDPEVFLAKVGKGRTLADYKKKQTLFSQGDPADAIFYIQTGKVKLTVVSKQGKEAVVAIVGSMTSLEKVAWPASRCVWPAPPPCQTTQLCGWKSRVWFV
jgi:hypothetical protein